SVSQPSRPPQTRHRSVAQRWSGAVATEGKDWIRGRLPTARLRTCQPLSWKIRCTVFLFIPSRPATVRYPNEGSSSIISLIGSASSGLILGGAFVGRQYTLRRATPNQRHILTIEPSNPSSRSPCWI